MLFLNRKNKSTNIGIVFLTSPMYVMRFWAAVFFVGVAGVVVVDVDCTSNPPKKGRVEYSDRSRMTRDGEPGSDRSIPATASMTTAYKPLFYEVAFCNADRKLHTCTGVRPSTSGLKSGELV